jgi:alanyl aminopeptidase
MNHRITGTLAKGISLAALFSLMAVADQQPPKLRLPDVAAPTSYKAALTLDPAKDTFEGSIQIKLEIKQPVDLLWLNGTKLNLSSVVLKIGGKTLKASPVEGNDDFVGLKFDAPVPTGNGELDIQYSGAVRTKDSSGVFRMLDNGTQYLYTQFESTDARDVFPCFDEPSYKVPWQLTLTVPSSDTAISNTSIAKQEQKGSQTTYFFHETKPLPSYLIAFGVGPFDYVDGGTAGKRHIPVRIVTPKGHADEAKYAAEVTATIITRLEDYFGIPFPYDKSDQVAIPVTFGFGAMENAGMVTYGQTIILAKPSVDTTARQREYASTAAHELAHQWFGDLVTTAWWNDIWLNEAFATWTEQKIIREWKPEWQTDVNDVSAKLGAEEQDSLVSSRKIRQEIVTKDDISNAFDGITYQKGAAVIAMFENWVGPENFRMGVRSYLNQYAFRNATAPEFLDAISTASKKNVTAAFSTFLNQAGVPLVSVALDCNQGAPTLHLEQQRFAPLGVKAPASETWQIPMCVRYGSGVSGESACEVMTQPKQDWTLKAAACPAWVEANDRALGYYRVDYQSGLLKSLTSGEVDKRLSAPERADFMGNASALATAGKLPAGDALALVQTFAQDPERHVVQSALDLALEPVEHEVPDSLMPNYQRFLQKNFQARAREIGWTPKPGEVDDVRLLRPALLRLMSTWGDDQQLASEAKTLAEKWLADHSSVDPNLVSSVLNTTAFYGNKAFFDQLTESLKTTKDRQERERIISAMARFRDPEAITAGFNVVLNGNVPFIEGAFLLFGGQTSPTTRHMSLDFLKAHYDEILAKRPTGGGFDFGSVLPYVGASYCDAAQKDELKSFLEPRVDKLLGAPRNLQQVLESIDVCIAQTAEQAPSVEAFLKSY